MVLSPRALSRFQRCERLSVFEAQWMPLRWRPRALFDVVLRKAALSLSSGTPKEKVTAEAVAAFLEVCASPGLDVQGDTYTLAHCWASVIKTVVEAISRLTLLTVTPGPGVVLAPNLEWRCAAFADESGVLHRWVSADKLDSDTLARELHSWYVWGDGCASQMPMVLHVVEVGRMRNGRQHTPWCRAFSHPVMMGMHRFQQVTGAKLQGNWKPVWFQDSDRNEAKTWVDLMESDNVKLLHHLDVRQPSVAHCEEFRKDMLQVAHRMSLAPKDPFEIVMNRTACDLPWPCDFQSACYSHGKVDMEGMGMFRRV